MPPAPNCPGGAEGGELPEPRGTLRKSEETNCFVIEQDDDPDEKEVSNYR